MKKQKLLKQKIERGLQGWGVSRVLHTAPHHDDIMLGYYSLIMRSPQVDHHMMYLVSGSNGVADEYLYRSLPKEHELIELYERQGDFRGSSMATLMKMMIRESEEEQLWNRSGIKCGMSHMRSTFYNDPYFNSKQTFNQDASSCLSVIEKFSPELILVLHDSHVHGPNTHQVSFRIVMEAVRAYEKDVPVWGYRNVWDRYSFDEAWVIVPVSQAEYDQQHKMFVECFGSQKKALYPSQHGTEPFTVYAQNIQKEQYQEAVALLGEDYFKNHADKRMRSAVGLILFEKVER